MKKIIILIMLLASIHSYGQKIFSFGVRAGYGYSNLIVIPKAVSGIHFKPTVQVGIVGEYKLPKNLFLQVEVLYTNPGYSITETITDNNGNYYESVKARDGYNCIQVPVQAKIKAGNKIKRYYMLGVAPTILLSESQTNLGYPQSGGPKKYVTKVNTKYDNTVNASILNTFGLEFNIGKIGTFVDFRYVQGITNVSKTNSTVTNVNIQFFLSAGIKI